MNYLERFLKKNASNILTFTSSLGFIGTVILAVKATPKALKLIEEAEYKKYNNKIIEIDKDSSNEEFSIFYYPEKEKLTIFEVVKTTWKEYLPSILLGSSTILCIFGSNYLNKQYQKNLISAYSILNNSYLQFKENTRKLYGDNADKNISKELLKDVKIDDTINDNEPLFFDCISMRYFNSTIKNIRNAEKLFNEHLSKNGYATLNELYELIGIPVVKYGYDIGWSTYLNDQIYSYEGIKIDLDLAELDDELNCWVMNIECEPTANFI